MMYCEKCGAELKDDAKFCAACGWKVGEPLPDSGGGDDASPTPSRAPDQADAPEDAASNAEAATPAEQPAGDPAAQRQSEKKPNPLASLSRNAKIGIGVGIIAVVVIIIAVVAFSVLNSGVSTDTLRADLQNSSIVKDGIVSDNYVDDSPYELTDLKINSQEEQSGKVLGTALSVRTVKFSGTIKNANFETQMSGTAYYMKNDDTWAIAGSPSVDSSTTTPLKGVDHLGKTTGFDSYGSSDPTVSDFQSDLSENNGTYTSTASQTVSYDLDIATDTAKNQQTFVFDQTDGWTPQGDVQVSDATTEWNLAGRTFEYAQNGSAYSGSATATLAFGDNDEDGNPTATYTITYTQPSKKSSGITYHDLSLEGSLSLGVLQHDFGSKRFSFELNDPENNITFKCATTSSSTVAGSGTVTTLNTSVTTDAVYQETSFFSNEFTISSNFTEVV